MVATVTLTGQFTKPDGTPAEGTVKVRPSWATSSMALVTEQRFPLVDGAVNVNLPASFEYEVRVAMSHAHVGPLSVQLPASGSVDLVALAEADPTAVRATKAYVDQALAGGGGGGGLTVAVTTTEPAPGVVWVDPEEDA